jgi:uncharacterized protein (DUF1501 family)
MSSRRTFLKVLGTGAAAAMAGLPPLRSIADVAATSSDDYFLFIHAAGGWDVTLWADPRNEARGLVHPASSENTDTAQVRLWRDAPLEGGVRTFELVRPPRSSLVLGPGAGGLVDIVDRITIVNGLAMNTVAHPDGATFSATGRHLQGGRVASPSVDTILANELGASQLFPTVSVRFPSAFVGDNLDRRVVPLVVGDVATISRTLARAQLYDSGPERDRVTALLSEEATDLARRSSYADVVDGMGLQYQSLEHMLASNLGNAFSADGLKKARPELNYKARFMGAPALNAAFAVEAMKRNVVRCVSFAAGNFDTHAGNYRTHAQAQQELFDLVLATLRCLDAEPHPTRTGARLSDHTHILVVSEFCRTPQINLGMGRDHYPNNSALVISPRFRPNFAFGGSDVDQLLPRTAKRFIDGDRAVAPPDLLATFVSAFGVDPRKYMRDGEVVPELLRS